MKLLLTCIFSVIFGFQSYAFAVETFSISYDGRRVVRQYPEGTQPVIGLALSGGGARGIAHIGVIEVLEENGIRVERIAGTSMGSIVGGLYAAGYSPKTLANIFEATEWSDSFSNDPRRRSIYVTEKETLRWPLFDLRFEGFRAKIIPSSLSYGQKIIFLLSWLTLVPGYECGGDFDRLSIPFRSVATDLNPPGDTVILGSGNLTRAIQASATIPLLFIPVEWEGRNLVDGGLKSNLPINIVKDMGSDFVIGIAIDESMHPSENLNNALNIADQSTSILMRNLTELSKEFADFVITPDMENFSSRNFTNIPQIIEQGRIAARPALPALLDSLEQRESLYKKTFIRDVTVSPEHENDFVTKIVSEYIQSGVENHFAQISSTLEALWVTGRYWDVRASIDEATGMLRIELREVPDNVTLILQGKDKNKPVNRKFEILTKSNSPGNFHEVIEHIDSLFHQIRFEGFSLAGVTEVKFDNSHNSLTIYANAPNLTKIFLDDNLKSRRSVITREFEINIGDTVDLNKIMKTIENLYGTNLFEWVYADLEPYDGGAALRIHLSEKDWSVIRLGFRFDETDFAEGRIALSRENILGFGNEFTAVGHTGKRKKLVMFESQNDRIYKTLYTFNIKTYRLFRKRPLYRDHFYYSDYEVDRYGTVLSLGQQMEKLGNAMLKFKTETLWTQYTPSSNMKNEKREIRSIIFQSIIDTYDTYPFPKNGKINVIFIESSHDFFGGTEKFVKMFWGSTHVKTFARKHTFSGSFFLGTADASTPYIESFTIGDNSTRLNCYDYSSASSHYYADFQGLNSEEKYGNYLAVGKINYRLFIPKYFYLSCIFNIGNVWDNDETITFDSLLQAYGIQGSFATYLGSLDIGWGITSEGDDRLTMSAGWEF